MVDGVLLIHSLRRILEHRSLSSRSCEKRTVGLVEEESRGVQRRRHYLSRMFRLIIRKIDKNTMLSHNLVDVVSGLIQHNNGGHNRRGIHDFVGVAILGNMEGLFPSQP